MEETATCSPHFHTLCEALNRSGRFFETCTQFNALKTNFERIEYVSKLPELRNIIIKRSAPSKKCHETSRKFVFLGYTDLDSDRYESALKCFNDCVVTAPYVSPEDFSKNEKIKFIKDNIIDESANPFLAGIVGRAEVLSKMGRYKEAIADIDRILTYDSSLVVHEFYFNLKALFLLENGRYTEAWEMFEEARTKFCGDETKLNRFTYLLEDSKRKHKKLSKKKVPVSDAIVQLNCEGDSFSCYPVPTIEFHNPWIPCASASVHVHFDQDSKRSVVATTEIDPGEVIIVESSFAHNLLGLAVVLCLHCLRPADTWYPCKGCRYVVYCSERCSKAETIHNFECLIMDHLDNDSDDAAHVHMALRVVLAAGFDTLLDLFERRFSNKPNFANKKGFNWSGIYHSSSYSTILDLEIECAQPWAMYVFSKAVHAYLVTKVLFKKARYCESQNCSPEFKLFVSSLVLKHALSMEYCALKVIQSKSTHFHSTPKRYDHHIYYIATGVYAFAGLLTHSCLPNAFAVFHGKDVVIRAMRPIPHGEKVTLDKLTCSSYKYELSERKQMLVKHYKLKCDCIACIKDWPMFDELSSNSTMQILTTPIKRMLEKVALFPLSNKKALCREVWKTLTSVTERMRMAFRPEDCEGALNDAVKCLFILEAVSPRPNVYYYLAEEHICLYYSFLGSRTLECIHYEGVQPVPKCQSSGTGGGDSGSGISLKHFERLMIRVRNM